MVSVSVCYLFYQPMDEMIKTWTLLFPAKENPNMEKALFDLPIVLQYDVKANYRLLPRKFSGMTFFQPSFRLTNQKPRTLCPSDKPIKWLCSVRLLFLFCSRVFISRSYETRSIWLGLWFLLLLVLLLLFFYTRVGIEKVEGMQKRTLF